VVGPAVDHPETGAAGDESGDEPAYSTLNVPTCPRVCARAETSAWPPPRSRVAYPQRQPIEVTTTGPPLMALLRHVGYRPGLRGSCVLERGGAPVDRRT